jgi:hypothetical protein
MSDPQLFSTDIVAPLPFAWHLLDEAAAAEHALELVAWVDWFTARYELGDRILPCWQQHGPLVEELTGLWCAWGPPTSSQPSATAPPAGTATSPCSSTVTTSTGNAAASADADPTSTVTRHGVELPSPRFDRPRSTHRISNLLRR